MESMEENGFKFGSISKYTSDTLNYVGLYGIFEEFFLLLFKKLT